MKKRILSLAMAACLALSMMLTLSACGKKNLEEYFNTDTMQKLVTSSVAQYESQGMELKMYAEGDELHYDLTLTTIETTDDDRSVYAEALEAGLAETAQTFVDAAKDVQKSVSNETGLVVVTYFDAAGVEYPTNDWTWDDYTAAAEKLTDASTGQYGSDYPTLNGVWYSLIGAAGDDVVKDGTLSFGNGLKETLEFQKNLVDNKWQPEPASGSKVSDMFAAGKAAMTMGGTWLVSTYKDADFNWDIATIPTPEGGRKYNSLHKSFWTISKNSKHKDAAKTLVKFLMSKEGQKAMSLQLGNAPAVQSMMSDGYYRVEGKHGPSNWDVLTQSTEEARLGYTMVSSTPTFELYDQFNAYVLGQTSLDEVTGAQVDKANKEITDAQ